MGVYLQWIFRAAHRFEDAMRVLDAAKIAMVDDANVASAFSATGARTAQAPAPKPVFGAAVGACCACSRLSEAIALLDAMRARGIFPDERYA